MNKTGTIKTRQEKQRKTDGGKGKNQTKARQMAQSKASKPVQEINLSCSATFIAHHPPAVYAIKETFFTS